MLNAKALSELLSKNSDERLCKRWYIMTPNGTLLAHTQPTDAGDLRQQVAMVALSWQEQQQTSSTGSDEANRKRDLFTLVLESDVHNILVRKIHPQLLLVLEGGVPPRKRSFEPRMTVEGPDGEPLCESRTADSSLGTSVSSKVESSVSTTTAGVLGLHKKKLDAMAAAIVADFEQTGFRMPEEGSNHLF
ncbi:hypothetical protein LTR91_006805 [Friedmanniomyces endolithicus]|uniref:Uncharacterized protein n=1 Tax=Friedmanniomyces endolithicus TaxID=329885 RepID=A0AAN6QVQ8_9PEZI|nr:hypothetical protein LTR94_013496 [Friedmanniomyces endolithicus]KAK0786700.1 hypothetical protein LTR38_011904 [Friedmanniomyces endolithicus]KAK0792761.1 hypothetical protein LTR75_011350 [Friedmanniomyces endolithicus]KAK0806471.1 hypothetical protein LTR59_003548 [Friedmanniomyces endolithicus]KAK0840561.1 hypothetical protein LTR03_010474 [Friedmanniomyces endolithicus]